MHFSFIIASLLLGAPVLAVAQDSQAPASETAQAMPADDLGGPVKVGDVQISENEIKRFLIYGPCRAALEYRRVDAMLKDEAKRRIAGYDDALITWEAISASGADAGPKPIKFSQDYFKISEEEFAVVMQEKVADFTEKYPTLSLGVEVTRAFRSPRWHERELRQERLFDLTFLSDNPDYWPELTFEALRAEAGEILITDFRESYERRLASLETSMAVWEAAQEAGGDPGPKPIMPAEDNMYRSILRQIVRDTVYGVCDTKTSIDGISPDLAVTMDFDFDGEPELVVTIDEVWDDVKETVSHVEIKRARKFLALIESTRQRLANEGKLLSDEDQKAFMDEVQAGFGSDIFGLGTVALGAHQFPSVESYAAYMPLIESYKESVAADMERPAEGGLAPALRGHLDFANQVMGLAKVDAEMLLVSAFNWEEFDWIDDGWAKAQTKAEWLKTEIEKNGVEYAEQRKLSMEAAAAGKDFTANADVLEPHDFWSRLIDEHSDFWDPPPPAVGKPGSDHGYKKSGRFGERTRNDMRMLMNESPFTNFLQGGLLTDEVFFRLTAGSVAGPIRGPDGWYLVKVMKRLPTQRPLNVNDEKHLEILQEDWVRISFIEYAHGALDMAGLGDQDK